MKTAKGFTLIELLVVISIIGILATLVAANLNSARSRARDAERKSDLKNVETAMRLYFNDKGVYPASDGSGNILGCGLNGTSICTWGSPWVTGGNTCSDMGVTCYMQSLPSDPLPGQNYKYELGSGGDTFIMTACLENASDAQGITTVGTSYNSLCSTSHWMFQIKQ